AIGQWRPHLRSWSMRRDLLRVADEPGSACNAELRAELHMPHGQPITAASMPRWLHQAAAARPSLCLAVLPEGYTPRATTETVLHQVVRTYLDRFLETAAATDGAGLPASSSASSATSSAAASSSGASPGCGATRVASNASSRSRAKPARSVRVA